MKPLTTATGTGAHVHDRWTTSDGWRHDDTTRPTIFGAGLADTTWCSSCRASPIGSICARCVERVPSTASSTVREKLAHDVEVNALENQVSARTTA